ncbi:hypothetical protein EON81_02990 [bacterium]|nr:MAG: hypothetical protein EON81_02990 [bacterium]
MRTRTVTQKLGPKHQLAPALEYALAYDHWVEGYGLQQCADRYAPKAKRGRLSRAGAALIARRVRNEGKLVALGFAPLVDMGHAGESASRG